ncbi:MAG: phospholipid carrier-dependent glycosyltransferase [Vicinamibacteria bacterium]
MKAAAVLACGLALYLALALASMRGKTSTFDECAHLPAAYTHLALRDFRLSPDHPPLAKLVAAAPLLWTGVHVKPDDDAWRQRRQWEFGKRFLYRWNDADTLFRRSRTAVALLACALAAGVFAWTRRHWGLAAGTLALFLCVLSPDVLAHGQIVSTDLGAALFVFLSVAAFERVTERATWGRLLAAGAAFGAALATKFSALVLLPVLGLLAVASVFWREPIVMALTGVRATQRDPADRRGRVGDVALLLAGLVAAGWFVIWASYLFQPSFTSDPVQNAAFDWEKLRPESALVAEPVLLARRLRLLPDPYLYGFFRFFKHSEARPSFLLGERSERGFAWFFPATFALKTPIGLMLLLALCAATWRRHAASRRVELFLWLPVAVYLALTLTRGINIGHRHLLPIYPFLFVAAGRAAVLVRGGSRPLAAAVVASAAWYGVSVARVHPHYLAYFNEAAGGPANGYRLLVDSSLDWGQDLAGLRDFLAAHGIAHAKLSYFGTADPEYHRVPVDLLPGYMLPRPRRTVYDVAPGDVVAVSATNLQEVYVAPEVRPLMALLRAREPIGQVGYSILVYRADFAWSAAPATEPASALE